MYNFKWIRFAVTLLTALPVMAAGGGEPMVLVADSRKFSGWRAWWSNLYNESHFWLALITILVIPTLGLVMGKATEFLLARIGINLKSRVLAEH